MTTLIQCGHKLSKNSKYVKNHIFRGHLAALPLTSIPFANAAVGIRGWMGGWVGWVVVGWLGFSHGHNKPSSLASVLGEVSGVRDAIRPAR